MKNLRQQTLIVLSVFICLVSCNKYDDGELWSEVNSLKDRVSSIEEQLRSLNNDISSIKSITEALQNRIYLTSVNPVDDGYVLYFSDGSKAEIHDGEDGADGKDAPIINVQYYEGMYYWVQTVDGETSWLLDANGNKIQASASDGQDGVTPLLKVDSDGYWIISYDNGSTYSKVKDSDGNYVQASGKDGDTYFQSVIIENDELRLMLADGTEILMPIGKVFAQKAIDLGLSVKWANMNVGAENSSDYGTYCIWGDGTGTMDWSTDIVNHTYAKEASDTDISGTSRDFAHTEWGGAWRTPTYSEFYELAKNTSYSAVTVNGVKCLRLKSNVNGNYIDLPKNGMLYPSSWSSSTGWEYGNSGEGTTCCYITSKATLQDGGDGSKYLYCYIYSGKDSAWNFGSWMIDMAKFNVRPVCE